MALVIVFVQSCWSTRITAAQESQLKMGMSRAEVLQILGQPHHTYGDSSCIYWSWATWDPLHLAYDGSDRLIWMSN